VGSLSAFSREEFGGDEFTRGFASKLMGFDASGSSLLTVVARHERTPTGTRVHYSVALLELSSKKFHPVCDLACPFM
jgi:hypothetical protein